ncbi:MAG TPA: signal peptidase II, partial [Armatimonadetes bacterium]|nr:signal peptidase II [Armatimonadota bacterium]
MNLETRPNHAMDEPATVEAHSRTPSWMRWATVCLIAFVVVIADQWTKMWIRSWLPLGGSRCIFDGILWFTHIQNPGGAFGLFPNAPYAFLAGAIIVLVLFIIWGRQAI